MRHKRSLLNGTVSAFFGIEWNRDVTDHKVPTKDEILFVLEIIDQVGKTSLQVIEALVENNQKWDNVSRNDFCRSAWFGQSMLTFNIVILLDISTLVARSFSAYLPSSKKMQKMSSTLVSTRNMKCPAWSFLIWTLLQDLLWPIPKILAIKKQSPGERRWGACFLLPLPLSGIWLAGKTTLMLSLAWQEQSTHICCHMLWTEQNLIPCRRIMFKLESKWISYGQFALFNNIWSLNRSWMRQKDNSRLVLLKRAQVYHSARLYLNSLYRRRSELDDKLLKELVELSLSPYTRVRRYAELWIF